MAPLSAGHDAAVGSVPFLASDPEKPIAAAKASGVGRYLAVGGAPASMSLPPSRPGKFRIGTDPLLADGKSWISSADQAVAQADEINRPTHIRKRFTAGY